MLLDHYREDQKGLLVAPEGLCVHTERIFTGGRSNFSLVAVKTARACSIDSYRHINKVQQVSSSYHTQSAIVDQERQKIMNCRQVGILYLLAVNTLCVSGQVAEFDTSNVTEMQFTFVE